MDLADDKLWPLLDLDVDPAQIFADRAQRQKLEAAEEQDCRHQGRIARNRNPEQQRADDQINSVAGGCNRTVQSGISP